MKHFAGTKRTQIPSQTTIPSIEGENRIFLDITRFSQFLATKISPTQRTRWKTPTQGSQ